jgi:hypothetical protein
MKLPWVEFLLGVDGKVVQVWCKVCTQIKGKLKLLFPKINSLWKHAKRHKALVIMPRVKVALLQNVGVVH